jgi:hypothetical protein
VSKYVCIRIGNSGWRKYLYFIKGNIDETGVVYYPYRC